MVGLALAALVFQKPVSPSPRAMRLDALLEEVSSQTGGVYRVVGSMAGRIVIVAGPPRSVGALQKALAEATWGRWRAIGNEQLLDVDRDAVAARERERLAARVEAFRQTQKDLLAKTPAPFGPATAKSLKSRLDAIDGAVKGDRNKAFQRFHEVDDMMPSLVASKRVIAQIDPVDLASLPEGTTVYSDRPTRLQRPLPQTAVAAIRQLEKDQNVWSQVNMDAQGFQQNRSETGLPTLTMDPRNYDEPTPPGGLRLVLKVQRQGGDGNHIYATAWYVDKERNLRQFADVNLDAESPQKGPETQPPLDPNEKPLPLNDLARAYLDAASGKPSPGVRTAVLAPDRNEPLDFVAGEVLREIAERRKTPLVACLGDDVASLGQWGKKEQTAGEWLRTFRQYGYAVTEGPDGTVVRLRGEVTNADRAALGRLLASVDRRGGPTFDALVDYAASTPPTMQWLDSLTSASLNIVVVGAGNAVRTDWRLLRLWSAFGPAQRQTLRANGSLAWETLTPVQREAVTQAILRAENYEIREEQTGTRTRHRWIALDDEPTEILANGFTMGGKLSGQCSDEESVMARGTSGEPDAAGFASAWGLANAVAERERTPGGDHYDGLPKTLPGEYLLGRELRFGLRMNLSPTLVWNKSGTVAEFDLRAKPQPLESMPPAFLKQYNESLEMLRKRGQNG